MGAFFQAVSILVGLAAFIGLFAGENKGLCLVTILLCAIVNVLIEIHFRLVEITKLLRKPSQQDRPEVVEYRQQDE
jgi:hypothetical protein